MNRSIKVTSNHIHVLKKGNKKKFVSVNNHVCHIDFDFVQEKENNIYWQVVL